MTSSMSLSTHHLWHSLHITSPQYVDKVRIQYIFFCVLTVKTFFCYFYQNIWMLKVLLLPASDYFCSVSPVPRNQLLSVAAACKVLIEFSLLRLENPDEACAVSQVRESAQLWDCIQRMMFGYFYVLRHFKPVSDKMLLNWSLSTTSLYPGIWKICYSLVTFCNTQCFFAPETPDSSNKRTLHWLQQTRSHRNHYFHSDDEVCQVASNSQDPFRW